MQNAEDRRQLMDRHGVGPAGPVVAVLRCAAGILMLVGVAAGPWLLLGADPVTPGAAPAAFSVVQPMPDSIAESRRVFEERRQRHEAQQIQRATPAQGGAIAEAQAAEYAEDR